MKSTAHGRDVAVVTPWYPTPEHKARGAFVEGMVKATAPGCGDVTVYHTYAWIVDPEAEDAAVVADAHRSLLPSALRPEPTVAGARLVRVPALTGRRVAGQRSFADLARGHALWLREALGGEPIPAPIVHAHVGLRGGWTAVENARPDARVFVTEHASFLGQVLDEPDSREMYREVLARCTGFLVVSETLREQLSEAFPDLAHKIGMISNPIFFDAPRNRPVTELRRWLYVGGLIEHKGVGLLLEAFAKCHAEDRDLTLTMVGDGRLAKELTARAAELGVEDAVTLTGALQPDEALRRMREHDVLVHPSRGETFGVAIVEAVAAGLPVLVTRCGGPQVTLAGVEDAAGEMIDVDDDPDTIVAGYRRLRERFPDGLDLPEARRVLDERYGHRTVAEEHYRHWFPDDPADDRRTDAP
ncbi:glycosyltransferase [Actinomadura sp. KC216]|uniref:glycosyltransferase n=1 Tax=Actinomadura sp. KC216 TaxID=2530370 RepID=UPI001A9FB3ED|nr:glycosyltransferase [Actinomadura sp. KC216]